MLTSFKSGVQGAFSSIGNFFGSIWKSASDGFSEGAGWAEDKRKEEERKVGQTRSLTNEELEKEMQRESTKFYSYQFAPNRRITSSMLLAGGYRR
ncbi:hypothetical protein AP064_05470 [Candidatus Liberibacter solanacearum]|uniref:Uncharacterized protein n=1 Tax=Candidatus Liberibacter solanacearum TaxID=556287 RepID=A0A0F4VJA4_9HYPH|nr:hypothetical protein [Candidatus Liberibacter solanacearum]KJZ81593.1 hypothetical protein DJ66_0315 [Candidatus Liberibacter solanacearum]KQC48684.1 hypothetical protein AP064_05470 [Candidatus Liberibacter solanacearum]